VNNIQKRLNITSSNQINNLCIINTLGQVVLDRYKINQNSYNLDISGLKRGIYIVNINNRSYKISID
ncbi:MAG: T9SS type A sorting domain-containing protein, partial [Bacteroidales bacterium]